MKEKNHAYPLLLELIAVTALIIITSAVIALAFGRAGAVSRQAAELNRAVDLSRNEIELAFAGKYPEDGTYKVEAEDGMQLFVDVKHSDGLIKVNVEAYGRSHTAQAEQGTDAESAEAEKLPENKYPGNAVYTLYGEMPEEVCE